MSIRIVTDSCSDLPPGAARDYDITVVPLYVNIGNETYRDGVEIGPDRFYSLLEQLPVLPTTSQPSVGDFHSVYERLLDEGHQVVSIHISGRLSGTCNAATQAKESLGNPPEIAIVDSRLAGGAQGLLSLNAAQWAREMTNAGEVAQRAELTLTRHHGFAAVDTLKYLQKGGRIGRVQAFVANSLQFKPIIGIRDGLAYPMERPRTFPRAVARVITLVRSLAPLNRIHVSYTSGGEHMQPVIDGLADLVEPENLIESRFGPVLGTHLGPNTIGIAASQPELDRGDP